MTPTENRDVILEALLKARDHGAITDQEYTTAYNSTWQLVPATVEYAPPICPNCKQAIVGHNGSDWHVSPCLTCDSDGHAACQHR